VTKTQAIFFISLLAIVFALYRSNTASETYTSEDCSCIAPHESCSVRISCEQGCIAICGIDACYAGCSGSYEFLGTKVTLELRNGTYPQLVTDLSRLSGRSLAFSPTKPTTRFNTGFKRALLWDALEVLADRGTLHVAGQDFEDLRRLRKILLSGERISFSVKNTPTSTFVNDMAGLTGLPISITSGNPMATVNIQLENVTLDDILIKVSKQTDTKITEGP
jgi:hypothetical protein